MITYQGMIEAHEKDLKDAQSKGNGGLAGAGDRTQVETLLRTLGLTLLPAETTTTDGATDGNSSDDGPACHLGNVGRVPFTKSSILGKSYNRTLTHYRPWPQMSVIKPLMYGVSVCVQNSNIFFNELQASSVMPRYTRSFCQVSINVTSVCDVVAYVGRRVYVARTIANKS